MMDFYRIENHKPAFLKMLTVSKVDSGMLLFHRYVQDGKYLLADIYINKVLAKSDALHNESAPGNKILGLSAQAFVAFKLGNPNQRLEYLQSAMQIKGENCDVMRRHCPISYFVRACELAGNYFFLQQDGLTALKYYQFARNNCSADENKKNDIKKKLRGLTYLLTSNLKAETKKKLHLSLFSCIKAWPKQSVMIIYLADANSAECFRNLLNKRKIAFVGLKDPKTDNERNAFAFTISHKFNFVGFNSAIESLNRWQERKEKVVNKSQTPKLLKEKDSQVHSEVHVSALSYSRLYKPGKKVVGRVKKKNTDFEVDVCEIPAKRLEDVVFPKKAMRFSQDENSDTGVVSVLVNGQQGIWYACLDPNILQDINDPDGAITKMLLNRFSEKVLTTDFIVPCFKEMKQKSKALGTDLPYVFKIRLPQNGIGDPRLYAEIVEVTEDGKRLVQFNAYNPKSHKKHTRPNKAKLCDTSEKDNFESTEQRL